MAKRRGEEASYGEAVQAFVETGAELIGRSIEQRYGGRVAPTTRKLEPGFIPPDCEARVLIVSYFPNSSDLDRPETQGYKKTRDALEEWRALGTVEAYRGAYEDWLAHLDRIPFHRNYTKPILDAVGLRNEEIAWIPYVKAPMKQGSSPGEEIMDVDKDATWAQIHLLEPKIVWVQGSAVFERVSRLVEERVTDRIVGPQNISQWLNGEKRLAEQSAHARRLRRYLDETA